ncbi:hypothetical protein DQ384_14485 [Sphaerisporangium album]|uniref:Uncharacterized protein n=1 Tax=Sphaerisporangium album TaxID=509200 RepID=A0A367FLL3_9ACTN|nr:hypothetical protein [Sphaerisporangium album]RCG30515.1 hypothetical protein DQ384_14485 [Sphaerisporangium album]
MFFRRPPHRCACGLAPLGGVGASRRRRKTGEDLLYGLLCDGSNPSVRLVRQGGVDVRRLGSELSSPRLAA